MGIKRFGILSFLKSAFDAMPATIEGQLMKIQDVLVSVNDCLDDVVDISHQPRARDPGNDLNGAHEDNLDVGQWSLVVTYLMTLLFHLLCKGMWTGSAKQVGGFYQLVYIYL